MLTLAVAPVLTLPMSCSDRSAMTQTEDRSVTWYSISPGMKRMPCSAFFSVTTPETGEGKEMLRCGCPDRINAVTCSADRSQLRRRVRLESASCFMPAWASGPASFIAAWSATPPRPLTWVNSKHRRDQDHRQTASLQGDWVAGVR